jgi:hypothetical protein
MHTCNIAVLATYSPLCVHQTLELHLRVHIKATIATALTVHTLVIPQVDSLAPPSLRVHS